MLKRKIGFLLFDNFTAMDISGPLEVFAKVTDVTDYSYELITVATEVGTVKAESGIGMVAEVGVADVTELDTLVIPGGKGTRSRDLHAKLIPWLVDLAPKCRRIVSVCTGSFLLAESGLLDGQSATTHWAFLEDFRQQYPRINIKQDGLFVINKHTATSAGIAAGIDLSLKLVEDDLGAEVAARVARYMVVHFRRAGSQAQYSEPLQYQTRVGGKFANLTSWILDNLTDDLSLDCLAEQCGMSVRTFCRRFSEQMDCSPGRYVENLRLDFARQLLTEKSWPISRIAEACGYNNTDVFRRAFERRFEVTPSAYKASFT